MAAEPSGSGTTCRVCESRVSAGQRFCGTCGTPVRVSGTSTDAPVSDTSVPAVTPSPEVVSPSVDAPPPRVAPSPTTASDPPPAPHFDERSTPPTWPSPASAPAEPTQSGTSDVPPPLAASYGPPPPGASYAGRSGYLATPPSYGNMGPYATRPNDPYPSGVVAAGVIASIFMPLISLIVALVLGGSENNPARKSQLKSWAMLSGTVMLVVFVLFVGVFSAGMAGGM